MCAAAGRCSGTRSTWGELNSLQDLAWRKSIEAFDERNSTPRSLALFPEDCEGLRPDESVVLLRMSQMRLVRPRPWAGVGWRCNCGVS